MTQHELDTIDERADREIFELLCCAMTKCHINNRKPSKRLRRKYDEARMRFDNTLPPGTRYVIDCRVEHNRLGRPKRDGRITCRIITMDTRDLAALLRGRAIGEDDDDDDDTDDMT